MGGAGRPAGPILAARAAGRGAGLPAGCAVPVGPLANFGSVGSGASVRGHIISNYFVSCKKRKRPTF